MKKILMKKILIPGSLETKGHSLNSWGRLVTKHICKSSLISGRFKYGYPLNVGHRKGANIPSMRETMKQVSIGFDLINRKILKNRRTFKRIDIRQKTSQSYIFTLIIYTECINKYLVCNIKVITNTSVKSHFSWRRFKLFVYKRTNLKLLILQQTSHVCAHA